MGIPVFFGEKESTHTAEEGEFFCPFCRDQQSYKLVVVSTTCFMFVPIGPSFEVGRYVYCDGCGKDFHPSVLDREVAESLTQEFFAWLLLRVIIQAARAHGNLNPAKMETIQNVFQDHLTIRPTAESIIEEVRLIQNEGENVLAQLERIGPRLKAQEQDTIYRAVADVVASEEVPANGHELLGTIAAALRIDADGLRRIEAGE